MGGNFPGEGCPAWDFSVQHRFHMVECPRMANVNLATVQSQAFILQDIQLYRK